MKTYMANFLKKIKIQKQTGQNSLLFLLTEANNQQSNFSILIQENLTANLNMFEYIEALPENFINSIYIYWNFFPGFRVVEYFKIFVLFLFILVISVLLFGLAYMLSLSVLKDGEKLSQYECGFQPFDEATRQPFDVHFYIVGILFLIFDVEVALLFPWVLTLKTTGWSSFISMLVFLIILTAGFFYEWHRGALSWQPEKIKMNWSSILIKWQAQIAARAKLIKKSSSLLMVTNVEDLNILDIEQVYNNFFEYDFVTLSKVFVFWPEFFVLIMAIMLLLDNYKNYKKLNMEQTDQKEKRLISVLELLQYILLITMLFLVIQIVFGNSYLIPFKYLMSFLLHSVLNIIDSIFSIFKIWNIYLVDPVFLGIIKASVSLDVWNYYLFANIEVFNHLMINDRFGIIMKFFVVFTIWMLLRFSNLHILQTTRIVLEFPSLILFFTVSLMFLLDSNHIMFLFLCYVAISLITYLCAAMSSYNPDGRESMMKYFTLSALVTGLFLFGIFCLYCYAHALNYVEIGLILKVGSHPFLEAVILCFILVPFLFKLSIYPFHHWTIEVYEGTTTLVTGFFMIPTKIAMLAALFRLLGTGFYNIKSISMLLVICAMISLLWGSLGMYLSNTVKEFLAYSTIAHMGTVMLGMGVGTIAALEQAFYYLLLYSLTSLALFLVLLNTLEERTKRPLRYITDFILWNRASNALILGFLTLIFMAMANIPPVMGWFAKYWIFVPTLEAGYWKVALISMFIGLISTAYYLSLIKLLRFQNQMRSADRFDFIVSEDQYFYVIVILSTIVIFSPFLMPIIIHAFHVTVYECLLPVYQTII